MFKYMFKMLPVALRNALPWPPVPVVDAEDLVEVEVEALELVRLALTVRRQHAGLYI